MRNYLLTPGALIRHLVMSQTTTETGLVPQIAADAAAAISSAGQQPAEPIAASLALTTAETIASMAAPEAIAFLGAKVTDLETQLKAKIDATTKAHPIAGQAIAAANMLLSKLFPNESGLITEAEKLDL